MKVTIALGQMDVRLGQPEANLSTVAQLTAKAAAQSADLLVLPELWSTGYDLEHAAAHATGIDTGIFAETAVLAREHGLYIAGSCLSLLGPEQYGNTAVLFAPDGAILGHYSKTHLFRLMNEDQFLTAGEELAVVDAPWGKTGLSICYDLRFPELYRTYALTGVRLALVPAEWPHPRLSHWRTLLRARAIENQMFVVACNRVGVSKETAFFGHSCVLDPWGETLIEGREEPDLLTAVIDTEQVTAVRRKIPVFADRRPELYGK